MQRDASMKSGTFKFAYNEKEEDSYKNNNGIKIVDKANHPAYVLNHS